MCRKICPLRVYPVWMKTYRCMKNLRQSIVASTSYERIKTVVLFVQNIYNLRLFVNDPYHKQVDCHAKILKSFL